MLLYATTTSYEASRPVKKGSNVVLSTMVSYKNRTLGMLVLNADTKEIVYNKLEGNQFVPIYRESI